MHAIPHCPQLKMSLSGLTHWPLQQTKPVLFPGGQFLQAALPPAPPVVPDEAVDPVAPPAREVDFALELPPLPVITFVTSALHATAIVPVAVSGAHQRASLENGFTA